MTSSTGANNNRNKYSFWENLHGNLIKLVPFLAAVTLVISICLLSFPLVRSIILGYGKIGIISEGRATTTVAALNELNVIPNDTLLTILSLLIAFAGLLAYVFKEIVRRDLDSKIENRIAEIATQAKDTRIASRADNEGASAFALIYTHQYLWCDHICKNPKTGCDHISGRAVNFIEKGISFARVALDRTDAIIDKEGYQDIILKCKNNLVLALTFQINPSETDIKEAQDLSLELYKFALNNEKSEWPPYAFIATRALVLLRYPNPKNMHDVKTAGKLYQKLLGNNNEYAIPDVHKAQIREAKKFIKKILKITK